MEERKKPFIDDEAFRAINKYTGEVVYFNAKNIAYNNDFVYINNDDVIFILPETITPYTYKKDKNGKKIYMGDILRYTVPQELQEEMGAVYEDYLVQWDEEQAGFCISTTKNPYADGLSGSEDFEVVGNVFLNPELAEQFKNVRKTV